MRNILILLLIPVFAMISGCAKELGSDNYNGQAGTADATYEGKIVSIRKVTVKPDAGENSAGTLAGGALGAAGASAVGKGTGSLVAAVGGAIVGAVAGNVTEGAIKTETAVEYIVKTDVVITAENEGESSYGLHKDTRKHQGGGLVTVVQTADPALKIGTRVYVIISKKARSRIIAQ